MKPKERINRLIQWSGLNGRLNNWSQQVLEQCVDQELADITTRLARLHRAIDRHGRR